MLGERNFHIQLMASWLYQCICGGSDHASTFVTSMDADGVENSLRMWFLKPNYEGLVSLEHKLAFKQLQPIDVFKIFPSLCLSSNYTDIINVGRDERWQNKKTWQSYTFVYFNRKLYFIYYIMQR